jgi:hypothetical protein
MMKSMHKLLGDEMTREILLNSLVLIPTGKWETKNDNENMSVENGNYFQLLCGPTGMKFPEKIVCNDVLSSDRTAMERSSDSSVLVQKPLSCTTKNHKKLCKKSKGHVYSNRIGERTHFQIPLTVNL